MVGPPLSGRGMKFGEGPESMRSAELQFVRELAAGLAREVVNPITGIKGALEVFYRDLNLSEEDRAVFEEMLLQIRKLNALTRSFLEYALPPSPQFTLTNIHDIIHDSLALVRRHGLRQNLDNVSVVREFDEALPLMYADPLQLQQVFVNLILNALDAMSEGGTMRFETARRGDFAEIRVSDTGLGLGSDMTDKIFQPFFTTGTRGFGVGLSVSKRLIEQHGGEIAAESNATGTVFRVTIPLAREACPDGPNRT